MIRVFPQRTSFTPVDPLAFIGHPPEDRPTDIDCPVRISVVFTWDIDFAADLYISWSKIYSDVKIGGPAFGDAGESFTAGRFLIWGTTITSRGCIRKCKFCYVPKREGQLRELKIVPGNIINDNNLLACSELHIRNVFEMLKSQKAAIFKGGLDARLLKPWHIKLIDSIKTRELWFACDSKEALVPLRQISPMLFHIKPYKKRCYVLLDPQKDSLESAFHRLRDIYNIGFWPHAQLYKGDKEIVYSKEWRDLQRNWSRPAIFKTIMKKQAPLLLQQPKRG